MNYYAGIGSRETPIIILHYFKKVAGFLAKHNYILRSGHAKGADQAFELGCDNVKGQKEIYLPWNGFEDSDSKLFNIDKRAFEIAERFHPYWQNLKQGGQKLQARNSYQVLGKDLETPSKFVICWTKNGSGQGGTGQAIRMAKHYNIPVFDAGSYSEIAVIKENLKIFLKENTDINIE